MSSNIAQREIIIVRSLTDSDLGIFAAHRDRARSKQRAININAAVAKRMVSPEVFAQGSCYLDCRCIFRTVQDRSQRNFGKVGKNWRLGGDKLEAADFGLVDSKDFVLIRTRAANDGTYPVSISFVSRVDNRIEHQNVVALVKGLLEQSMAVLEEGTKPYEQTARLVPPPAARRAPRKTLIQTIRQTELTLWTF